MRNRATVILGLVFLGLAIWQGSSGLHRYTTPAQALAREGKVQVMGTLLISKGPYILGEDGAVLPLEVTQLSGVRLEPGKSVVAIGMVRGGVLIVDRLLYKCPSKYERG